MSSSPECKKCGSWVHHGPVICEPCSDYYISEIDCYRKALAEMAIRIEEQSPEKERSDLVRLIYLAVQEALEGRGR